MLIHITTTKCKKYMHSSTMYKTTPLKKIKTIPRKGFKNTIKIYKTIHDVIKSSDILLVCFSLHYSKGIPSEHPSKLHQVLYN